MRRAWIVVIVLSFLAGGTAAFAWTRLGDDDAPAGSARLISEGSEPIPAQPAPEIPPDPVAASGACADAMDGLRALMTSVPRGALLDDTQNAELTAALGTLDAACDDATATAFRDRELVPWLTYAPTS